MGTKAVQSMLPPLGSSMLPVVIDVHKKKKKHSFFTVIGEMPNHLFLLLKYSGAPINQRCRVMQESFFIEVCRIDQHTSQCFFHSEIETYFMYHYFNSLRRVSRQ